MSQVGSDVWGDPFFHYTDCKKKKFVNASNEQLLLDYEKSVRKHKPKVYFKPVFRYCSLDNNGNITKKCSQVGKSWKGQLT